MFLQVHCNGSTQLILISSVNINYGKIQNNYIKKVILRRLNKKEIPIYWRKKVEITDIRKAILIYRWMKIPLEAKILFLMILFYDIYELYQLWMKSCYHFENSGWFFLVLQAWSFPYRWWHLYPWILWLVSTKLNIFRLRIIQLKYFAHQNSI
jgi:hypothetical protein